MLKPSFDLITTLRVISIESYSGLRTEEVYAARDGNSFLYMICSIYTTRYADNSSLLLYKDVLSHGLTILASIINFPDVAFFCFLATEATQSFSEKKQTDRKKYLIVLCMCVFWLAARKYSRCILLRRRIGISL